MGMRSRDAPRRGRPLRPLQCVSRRLGVICRGNALGTLYGAVLCPCKPIAVAWKMNTLDISVHIPANRLDFDSGKGYITSCRIQKEKPRNEGSEAFAKGGLNRPCTGRPKHG